MSGRQIPLSLQREPSYREADFLRAPSNAAAWTWLERTEIWPERRLAIWGDAARGKTHLSRIWASRVEGSFIDGTTLSGFPDAPSAAGVAVDDADHAQETTLLHLLNAAGDLGRPVLLVGRLPPGRWPVTLRDLASRLRAITAVEVEAPDDDLLRQLLPRLLRDRGLEAGETLSDRLLLRLPRSPAVLRQAVDWIDREAWITGTGRVRLRMIDDALKLFDEATDDGTKAAETTE
jgi:chromosomal replication initiation ATPase DnaA